MTINKVYEASWDEAVNRMMTKLLFLFYSAHQVPIVQPKMMMTINENYNTN